MLERSQRLRHLRPNYLNLIILPTEACNFRCTYCYETFENKKMSRQVVSGIKSLIDRRGKELDELEISWFGGEPLLALDVVTEISRHAINVARAEGIAFSSGMTTNAYLLDRERFQKCLEHNVTVFQISLDGSAAEHNASRKLASGAGSFDRIWANLLAMKDTRSEFSVQLRLHYTLENFISVGQFARAVGDAFGSDDRFGCYFKHISRLGGPNDDDISIVSDQDKREIEEHLWQTSGLPKPSQEVDPYICYAAKGNSLLVRSTGRLGKCTVALNDDYNDIGWISESGEICVDQKRFQRWIAPLLEAPVEELECPLGWILSHAELDKSTDAMIA